MTIDSNTGKITWTPNFNQIGSYNIKIQATDSNGAFNTQTYTIQIVEATNIPTLNRSPRITSTPITQVTTATPYRYQVVAIDPDAGNTLTYSLINNGGASGLAINSTTGLVIWNTPNLGTYNIQIGVSDNLGAKTSQGYSLSVTNQPAITNTPPQIISTAVTRVGQGQPYTMMS